MVPVIVKLFGKILRKFMVLFQSTPDAPHASTFMPDAAIGGEVGAVRTLDGVTRSKLTLGRANLSHGASAMVRR
jgi:hypothetical protein